MAHIKKLQLSKAVENAVRQFEYLVGPHVQLIQFGEVVEDAVRQLGQVIAE